MPTTHPLAKIVALLVAVGTAVALAQPLTVERPEFDVRMSHRPTWTPDASGSLRAAGRCRRPASC